MSKEKQIIKLHKNDINCIEKKIKYIKIAGGYTYKK